MGTSSRGPVAPPPTGRHWTSFSEEGKERLWEPWGQSQGWAKFPSLFSRQTEGLPSPSF